MKINDILRVSILDGSFAAEVATALDDAAIPYDLTLTRLVVPSSPPFDPWDPPSPVPVEYPARGFLDEAKADWLPGSLVEAGDVRIVIIASSLEITPAPGDVVEAKGQSYTAVSVQADPAGATWQVQGRA